VAWLLNRDHHAATPSAVSVDQSRAEQAHRDDDRWPFALDAKKRHKGENAALAVVVHAHRDRHIVGTTIRVQMTSDNAPKMTASR